MPQSKNTFIKSKMNKDLDARLVPNGEYRDGLNIGISTSEGSDIGALENVLGNIKVADFGLNSTCNLEVIGTCVNEKSERIFLFITNFSDGSNDRLSSFQTGGESYICMFDAFNNTQQILVSGTFLNFSKTHLITGVNVLEDLLFWTDNRNQPRKINIESAIANSSYYTKEEQISVAKPAPIKPIKFYKTFSSTPVSTLIDTVSPKLPDGADNPYYNSGWVGDSEYLKDKFLRFSYRFKFDDGEYSLMAPFTQSAFIPEQDGYFIENDGAVPPVVDITKTYQGTDVDFMRNKVTQILIQIPCLDGISTASAWSTAFNDFHITEVDILAKEAGNQNIHVINTIKRSFFETNQGTPITPIDLEYIYNSEQPYKTLPSSDITRVSDLVPIRAATQEVTANRIIYGNFTNRPASPPSLNYSASYATKGGSDIDSPDRIEYQNHNIKQNRTYQVGVVLQDYFGRQSNVLLSDQDSPLSQVSSVYVPYRASSSSPPLVNNSPADTWPGNNLTINFESLVPNDLPAVTGYPGIASSINKLGYYAYRIVVKQKQQEYYNIYFPGILNGDTLPDGAAGTAASSAFPQVNFVIHGDNIDKAPRDLKEVGPDQKIFRSQNNSALGGLDNMTMPTMSFEDYAWQTSQPHTDEEISDYYGNQWAIYRESLNTAPPNSSLNVFLRVNNEGVNVPSTPVGGLNSQYFFPNTLNPKADIVTCIAKLTDLGLAPDDLASGTVAAQAYYNYFTSPLTAQTTVNDTSIGASATAGMSPTLAVYETKPVNSLLDIFWETTTAGTISELNTAIATIDNTSAQYVEDSVYSGSGTPPGPVSILNENLTIGSDATQSFRFVNTQGGATLTGATATLVSVTNGYGVDLTSKLTLSSLGSGIFKLVTAGEFVRIGGSHDLLTVDLRVNSSNKITNLSFNIQVLNTAPQFVAPTSGTQLGLSTTTTSTSSIYTLIATNGSINTSRWSERMYFSIKFQSPGNYFFLNDQGVNSLNQAFIKLYHTQLPTGTYNVEVEMRDAPIWSVNTPSNGVSIIADFYINVT